MDKMRLSKFRRHFSDTCALAGSIAMFDVLKVVEEITEPLYKTVIVVYTEDDPAGADLHDVLENAVRIKTMSALLQAPEADPDWQGAKQAGNSGVTITGDSDDTDDVF